MLIPKEIVPRIPAHCLLLPELQAIFGGLCARPTLPIFSLAPSYSLPATSFCRLGPRADRIGTEYLAGYVQKTGAKRLQ